MNNFPNLRRAGPHGNDDPYPLLPAQYAELSRGSEPMQPERRLMLAVLSDAIVTLAPAANRARRRDADAVERWIAADDLQWPCSFVNVCEALGLAHQPLRRALLAWHRRVAGVPDRPLARRRLLAGMGQALAKTG